MTLALVTGACGFMGSHLVDFLIEKGYRVRATDMPSADRSFLNSRAEFVPSDLTQPRTLAPLWDGVEVGFHVAALFSYSSAFADLYRVNAQGTRDLLRAALPHRDRIRSVVLWGAAGIYDFKRAPQREDGPVDPANNYTKTKYIQEQVALDFHASQALPVTVMRLATPYGPRQRYGMFVSMRLMALGQIPPFIVGDGKTHVSGLIHARDVAGAAEILSRLPEAAGEVYNVADDTRYTLEDLTCYLGELLDWPIYRWPRLPAWTVRLSAWSLERQIRAGGKPKVDRDMLDYMGVDVVLDLSKFKRLGYSFIYPDCRQGLRETVLWYRNHGWIP